MGFFKNIMSKSVSPLQNDHDVLCGGGDASIMHDNNRGYDHRVNYGIKNNGEWSKFLVQWFGHIKKEVGNEFTANRGYVRANVFELDTTALPMFNGIGYQELLDFSRENNAVIDLKQTLESYHINIWVKEKAGKFYVVVGSNEADFKNLVQRVVSSYKM